MNSEALPILLLSIKKIHADRIFDGVKAYELRKKLPKQRFSRVYLFESGGTGVVGCFDAGAVLNDTVSKLWERVGEASTPKSRFFNYFGRWKSGFAIEVENTIRFRRPVFPAQIRKYVPEFSAPQSYSLVWPNDTLYRILERTRCGHLADLIVQLTSLERRDEPSFVELVTSELSPKYAGITSAFAESVIYTHRLGYDEKGILTKAKEVLSIQSEAEGIIGFTTLTYKRGGSVKTGPTVLRRRFRGKGYGTATRTAIELFVTERGHRKLYCTCPDDDPAVVNYILKAGYCVEAHLSAHYHDGHGELVFGKLLSCASQPVTESLNRHHGACRVVPSLEFDQRSLAGHLRSLMGERFADVDLKLSRSIVRRSKTYTWDSIAEEKPVQLICLARGNTCDGIVMLLPKRGGAVKGLILSRTDHGPSLHNAIRMAEDQVRGFGKRKIYFLHPLDDSAIIAILRACGYSVEGVLHEAYQPGEDTMVLSRFMTGRQRSQSE